VGALNLATTCLPFAILAFFFLAATRASASFRLLRLVPCILRARAKISDLIMACANQHVQGAWCLWCHTPRTSTHTEHRLLYLGEDAPQPLCVLGDLVTRNEDGVGRLLEPLPELAPSLRLFFGEGVMLGNPKEVRDHRRHHYNTERVVNTRTGCRLRVVAPTTHSARTTHRARLRIGCRLRVDYLRVVPTTPTD
jgi:hypothetical protein